MISILGIIRHACPRWRSGLCYGLLLVSAPLQAGLLDQQRGGGGFLPADEAFMLEAMALEHDEIEVRWLIAPGYYLYRHRLNLVVKAPAQTQLSWQAPPGQAYEDEHFGTVEIYHHSLSLPVKLDANTDHLDLEISYQGCAEAGLCYPPMRKQFRLQLPAPK